MKSSIIGRTTYNRTQSKQILIDLTIYLIYLLANIIKAANVRDPEVFYFNDRVRNLFFSESIETQFGNEVTFDSLVTIADIWDYLEKSFIPNMYKNHKPSHFTFEGTIFLGPPRIRQIRVRNDTCNLYDVVKEYYDECYGQYSIDNEQIESLYQGTAYHHAEIYAESIEGELKDFHGGGYIKRLGETLDESTQMIKKLKSDYWIDRGTRLVALEMSIFNNNVNIFTNFKIYFEIPSTNGILPHFLIYSVACYTGWSKDSGYFIFSAYVIYLALHLFYSYTEIRTLRREGWFEFFTSFWHCLDIFQSFVLWLCFYYEFWHTYYVGYLISQFQLRPHKFLDLDILCSWNKLFMLGFAISMFCICIKCLKFLILKKILLQFSVTIRRSSKDLMGFLIMFGIIFLAYCLLGLLIFGYDQEVFRSYEDSIFTMIRLAIGTYDYRQMQETERRVAPIYFITYIVVVYFILLNIFLAILSLTYEQVKEDVANAKVNIEHSIPEIIKEWLRAICCCGFLRRKSSQNKGRETEDRADTGLQKTDEASDTPPKKNLYEISIHQENELKRMRKKFKIVENGMIQMIEKMDFILIDSHWRESKALKALKVKRETMNI